MVTPNMTVRTDRASYLLDEQIPGWRHPRHCPIHLVSWWTDDPFSYEIDEKYHGKPECPCCSGELPIQFLILIELTRIERHLARDKELTA